MMKYFNNKSTPKWYFRTKALFSQVLKPQAKAWGKYNNNKQSNTCLVISIYAEASKDKYGGDLRNNQHLGVLTPLRTALNYIPIILFAVLLMIGCRGDHSTKPPIHLNPNMDSQDKFKAQSMNPFFADSSAMRLPVEGTIAQGKTFGDSQYNSGKDKNDNFIDNPELLTVEFINRGEERFNIYCAVCHGVKGDGKGNIIKYQYPIPPTAFQQDWLIEKKDGYYFGVITNGIRTMPPYKHQIPVKDRWAIVSYVRKLQESEK